MSLSDKKLQKFEKSVFKEADAEIAKILKGIAQQEETVLAATRDDELTRHFDKMQGEIAKIKQSCIRRVSLEEQQSKKSLLLKREEISKAVFADVSARLKEFSETDEYKTFLKSEFEAAVSYCGREGSTLCCSAADEGYLKELSGDIPVRIDREIVLGGFILKNESKGIAVDRSFESRLDAQRDYFNTISNLTLEN